MATGVHEEGWAAGILTGTIRTLNTRGDVLQEHTNPPPPHALEALRSILKEARALGQLAASAGDDEALRALRVATVTAAGALHEGAAWRDALGDVEQSWHPGPEPTEWEELLGVATARRAGATPHDLSLDPYVSSFEDAAGLRPTRVEGESEGGRGGGAEPGERRRREDTSGGAADAGPSSGEVEGDAAEGIEVLAGNLLAPNARCPLSAIDIMDLADPVQDRAGVVYERETVVRWLERETGRASGRTRRISANWKSHQVLCPLAGSSHKICFNDLVVASKVTERQRRERPELGRRGEAAARHRSRSRLQAVALAVMALFFAAMLFWLSSRRSGKADTLVIYVAGYGDPEDLVNVSYFLDHGLDGGGARAGEEDGADFVIAVEPGSHEAVAGILPARLPPNVRVLNATTRCFNMGTVGWVLDHPSIDKGAYSKFVWLDSSVRGPFVPAYVARAGVPWHALLTSLLDRDTKLVGATISCAGVRIRKGAPAIHVPHVQGYLAATDRVGLRILLSTGRARDSGGVAAVGAGGRAAAGGKGALGGVFACHTDWLAAVRWSELGASEAILRAGYNLGSLMLRYQGVDWRDKKTHECNARLSPLALHAYDGADAHPLETLFAKAQHHLSVTRHPSTVAAERYGLWAREAADPAASSAAIARNSFADTAPAVLDSLVRRGQPCFDAAVYIATSPIELAGITPEEAWDHFLTFGFREGRPYRFIC